jgi:hypothetical protein
MTEKPVFVFRDGGQYKMKKTYHVWADGVLVGSVVHYWVRHLEMFGWEAIGQDGHRGVHPTRDKAAKALLSYRSMT